MSNLWLHAAVDGYESAPYEIINSLKHYERFEGCVWLFAILLCSLECRFYRQQHHVTMLEVWLLLMGFQILSGNLQAGKFDTSVLYFCKTRLSKEAHPLVVLVR